MDYFENNNSLLLEHFRLENFSYWEKKSMGCFNDVQYARIMCKQFYNLEILILSLQI